MVGIDRDGGAGVRRLLIVRWLQQRQLKNEKNRRRRYYGSTGAADNTILLLCTRHVLYNMCILKCELGPSPMGEGAESAGPCFYLGSVLQTLVFY